MQSFFDPSAQQELLERLDHLNTASVRQWGRMDAAQMLAHCTAALRMPLGELPVKTSPLLVIGWLWKGVITDGKPFRHSVPTAPEYTMTDPHDLETERGLLRACIGQLAAGPGAIRNPRHPFFGKLTAEQWGLLTYKHMDHHFSQFGV